MDENEKKEIEITPQMIEAGIDAYEKCDSTTLSDLVSVIYSSMRCVALDRPNPKN